MSIVMEEEIKRWTARRKAALVLEIIQGKATISEASRQFDLPPSEMRSRAGSRMPSAEWKTRCGPSRRMCAFETLQHAMHVIGDWIQFYNHRRPHQALGMKTPAEAYVLAA